MDEVGRIGWVLRERGAELEGYGGGGEVNIDCAESSCGRSRIGMYVERGITFQWMVLSMIFFLHMFTKKGDINVFFMLCPISGRCLLLLFPQEIFLKILACESSLSLMQ